MPTTCPECGARVDAHEASCPGCGVSARGLAEERRHLTVLFADICGSTGFVQDRDPELVHEVLADCITTMSAIVSRHGGTVIRVVGDEVMSLFGAPVARGDDATRAVRAALELSSGTLHGLAVRVGVSSGEVYLAPMGQGGARAFTASGATVHLAARLRSQAPPGGVLVCEETRRATRFVVDHRAVPAMPLAGFSAPVPAWAPLRVHDVRVGPMAAVPLVGRQSELQHLHQRWRGVRETGTPAVVTVLGAAGIGKTRLLQELVDGVDADGAAVLRGRCVPHARPTPYDAVAEILAELPDRSWGSTEPSAGHLRLLGGRPGREDDAPSGEAALVASLVGALESITDPVVVTVEDLHWSLSSQLSLLQHVLRRLSRGPVLVVVTARPELEDRVPDWFRVTRSHRLDLGPLPDDDAVVLLRAVAEGVGEPAVRTAVDVAGGSPLLLEEVAADLREGRSSGGAGSTSMKEVLSARLDGLPDGARSTVLTAAALQPVVTASDLAAACGRDVEDDLALLVRRGLLRLGEPGDRIVFRHQALGEVAHDMLPRRRRQEVHAKFAVRLERSRRVPPDLLAYHWREAGEAERAAGHLLAAAADARTAWAKADAARWYREALDLLPEGDERAVEVRLQLGLTLVEEGRFVTAIEVLEPLLGTLEGADLAAACLGLSTSRFWCMQTHEAQLLAERALEVSEPGSALAARAGAARSLALSTTEGRTVQGIAEGEGLLRRWPSTAPEATRLELMSSLGTYHYWTGDHARARQRAEEAGRLATATRDVDQALLAASARGMALVGEGRPEEALAVYEDAVTFGMDHELVPRFTSRLVSMLGGALREIGDVAAARAASGRAIDLARQVGFPFPVLQSQIDLLACDLLEGRHAIADRRWPDLHEAALALGGWHNWLTLGRLAVARAEIDLALGRIQAAISAGSEAQAYATRTHRPKYAVAAARTRGLALLAADEAGQARSVLLHAVAEADRLAHPPTTWATYSVLARIESSIGDRQAAERAHRIAWECRRAYAARLSPPRRRTFEASPVSALPDALGGHP